MSLALPLAFTATLIQPQNSTSYSPSINCLRTGSGGRESLSNIIMKYESFVHSHKLFYSMMTCIFPPVPGPKIKGFDTHLLEVSVRSRECDVTHCLMVIRFAYTRSVLINPTWPSSLSSRPFSSACILTEGSVWDDCVHHHILKVTEQRETARRHPNSQRGMLPRAAPEDRDDHFVQIMSLERERADILTNAHYHHLPYTSPSFHFSIRYKATVTEFSIVPMLPFEWSVDQYSMGWCFPKHTRLI